MNEDGIQFNDKVTFKIPANYPMNSNCIKEINKRKGRVKEIYNGKVASVEFLEFCSNCGGDICYKTDIELKYLEKIE